MSAEERVGVPPDFNSPQFEGLLPYGVLQDFIGLVEERSIALTLGNRMRMAMSTESIPLVSYMPEAKFVNPRYGGRKPITKIEWEAQHMQAEEIAAIVAVPTAWIRDANFDVENQVERGLANAVARTFDDAVIFGLGGPASYPPGGVGSSRTIVTGEHALDALSKGFSELEKNGVTPNGIGSSPVIGSVLRTAYGPGLENMRVSISAKPDMTIWGVPTITNPFWDATTYDAILGDWDRLAIGIREDIRFNTSEEANLTDAEGKILANLWQDNLTAVKVTFWAGAAVGKPLEKNNNLVDPFVRVKFPAGAVTESAASERGGTPPPTRRERSGN